MPSVRAPRAPAVFLRGPGGTPDACGVSMRRLGIALLVLVALHAQILVASHARAADRSEAETPAPASTTAAPLPASVRTAPAGGDPYRGQYTAGVVFAVAGATAIFVGAVTAYASVLGEAFGSIRSCGGYPCSPDRGAEAGIAVGAALAIGGVVLLVAGIVLVVRAKSTRSSGARRATAGAGRAGDIEPLTWTF